GRREAKRWSAHMYSVCMPLPILSMYGTGRAGSLMYSSKPVSAALDSAASRPLAWKWSVNGCVFFGGHVAYSRHLLVPVSKIHAFGDLNVPLPLRWNSKNGSSIFSRKKMAVLVSNETSPSEA